MSIMAQVRARYAERARDLGRILRGKPPRPAPAPPIVEETMPAADLAAVEAQAAAQTRAELKEIDAFASSRGLHDLFVTLLGTDLSPAEMRATLAAAPANMCASRAPSVPSVPSADERALNTWEQSHSDRYRRERERQAQEDEKAKRRAEQEWARMHGQPVVHDPRSEGEREYHEHMLAVASRAAGVNAHDLQGPRARELFERGEQMARKLWTPRASGDPIANLMHGRRS